MVICIQLIIYFFVVALHLPVVVLSLFVDVLGLIKVYFFCCLASLHGNFAYLSRQVLLF